MENWEIFEKSASEFLEKHMNDKDIEFKVVGGSDSTIPDINVYKNKQYITTIEAKFIPSQSGQIVVIDNQTSFSFSQESVNKFSKYTEIIIKHLNDNFSKYKSYSSKSIKLDIDKSILFNWVKTNYDNKGAKWIVSSKKFDNLTKEDLLFIPLNEMDNYFDISASFRIKRSGSGSVPLSSQDNVIKLIDKKFGNITYETKIIDKKLYILTESSISKTHLEEKFFISTLKNSKYEVRKLNGTENPNPNVVFELKLKKDIEFKFKEFKEFFHL